MMIMAMVVIVALFMLFMMILTLVICPGYSDGGDYVHGHGAHTDRRDDDYLGDSRDHDDCHGDNDIYDKVINNIVTLIAVLTSMLAMLVMMTVIVMRSTVVIG